MNSTATETVSEENDWTVGKTVVCTCIVLFWVLIYLSMHKLRRNGGRNVWYHVGYFTAVALIIYLLPNDLALDAFNPITITLVCTLYPIYESIRAVCTVDTDDDTSMLQYWIAQGILSFASAWVNDVTNDHPLVRQYWFECLFFYYVWLLLPFTDGAALLYDCVTEPFIVPLIAPYAKKMSNSINAIVTAFINAFHLWFVWFAFFFLSPNLKSIIAICIGTVYPFMASIIAVSTPQGDDDTYWLTYWSCYGILYLIMGFFEHWLKRVPGFYIMYILATIYLMLPMFKGADAIFRSILVPLSGQTEMLMLRDASILRMELESKIPESRRAQVLDAVSKTFAADNSKMPSVRRRPNYGDKSDYGAIEEKEIIV